MVRIPSPGSRTRVQRVNRKPPPEHRQNHTGWLALHTGWLVESEGAGAFKEGAKEGATLVVRRKLRGWGYAISQQREPRMELPGVP